MNRTKILEKLKLLATSGTVARLVITYLLHKKDNPMQEVAVEEIRQELKSKHHDISRQDVINVLKQLEELELGKFWAGRRGKPSRFQPQSMLLGIGRITSSENSYYLDSLDVENLETSIERENIAQSEPKPLQEAMATNNSTPTLIKANLITHSFALRPQLRIEINLPENLTDAEAERLSAYIKTLPFN